ncbi:MAG: glycosyltransferase family 4 protein [Vicinamibacterales bacterium]
MNILLVTDSFPPGCGGSGWSTYELARALRARGHAVSLVQPRVGTAAGAREYEGFTIEMFPVAATPVPYLRNYLKSERLHARMVPYLRGVMDARRIEIVHGQHAMSAPASITAAHAVGLPSVATVRDYWPVCYWSDLIHDPRSEGLCPRCSRAMMTRCIRPRGGAAWPLALPLVPYMARNLAFKRRLLASADLLVAVSSTIERDLRERGPELAGTRIVRVPNPVDCDALLAAAHAAPVPFEGRYILYAGKLAPNKGVSHLVAACSRARLPWPLVVVGDGPERAALEREASRAGLDAHFTGWLPRGEVIGWMAHASLLAFPSRGPESLSRVLIEASALGLPIAAMDTGGTRDIVLHEQTGLLSTTVEGLSRDMTALAANPELARRLGQNAAHHARETFGAGSVAARMEALYRELVETKKRRAARV